ncbi:MAG: hypothetical protein ACREN5_07880 [Gemmatimonadales bacterium]
MSEVVEVRFKGNRKGYYVWEAGQALAIDDGIIVEGAGPRF